MSTGVQIIVHNIDYTDEEEYIDNVYFRLYNLLFRQIDEEDYIDDIMYIISSTMFFLSDDDTKNDNVKIVYNTINYVEDFSCVICTEDHDTILAKLGCNHVFHRDCIVEWGKYKQECPLCRAPIQTV